MVGDTVKWVWISGSHTTTSTSVPTDAASWDSPINSSNTSFSYKVTVAGAYDYKCTPHAAMGMVGSFTANSPNTLNVAPSNQNVTAANGSTSFSVTSNTSWNASSNATWCTCTASGTGNGTITANYSQNLSSSQRIATITVTVSGVPPQQVTVTQAGSTLGVNDQAVVTFTIYPNPVRSTVNIASESLKTSVEEINIYNINSQRVLGPLYISGSPATIDLSTLSQGVYFIRIGNDKTAKVQRIIKTS